MYSAQSNLAMQKLHEFSSASVLSIRSVYFMLFFNPLKGVFYLISFSVPLIYMHYAL